MKTTIVKRSNSKKHINGLGCMFTFGDGTEIFANKEISDVIEFLIDKNIKVEKLNYWKSIIYFFLEKPKNPTEDFLKKFPIFDCSIDWEKSEKDQLGESLDNQLKMMKFGAY